MPLFTAGCVRVMPRMPPASKRGHSYNVAVVPESFEAGLHSTHIVIADVKQTC